MEVLAIKRFKAIQRLDKHFLERYHVGSSTLEKMSLAMGGGHFQKLRKEGAQGYISELCVVY